MSSTPPPMQPYSPQAQPPPPPKKGHGAAIAAVVIVVLLVAVGGLYYLGDLPFAKPSSSSTASTTPESFDQARPAADSAASGQSGGPWTLYGAFGLEFPAATKVNESGSSSSCPSSSSAPTSWAADSAGVGTGKTPIWLFEYGSSSGATLGVLVMGGVASEAYAYAAGSGCGPTWSSSTLAVPASGIVDSSAAASVALAQGGSAFLSAHTGAAVEDIIESSTSTGAAWLFEYSLCLANTGTLNGVEPTFEAEVNATTGTLVNAQASTTSCGNGKSTGISLALGPGSASQSGANYYDNLTVASTTGTLTVSMLGFKVTTPSGGSVSSAAAVCTSSSPGFAACTAPTTANTWYLVLISVSGSWLASYPAQAGGTTWNGGAITVSSGDTLSIVSSSALAGSGDLFSAFGTGSTAVSGQVTL